MTFIATAALVPLLILPAKSGADRATGAPPPSPAAVSATVPAIDPSSTQTPTPTSTPSPTPTPPSFLLRPAVKPRPVGNPPQRTYREFETECTPVAQTSKVPLPGVGPAGKTIQYLTFGNTATTLAEPGKVPTTTTSCITSGDRSSYWVPVLYQGRTAIRPDDFTVLYKSEVDDYTSVEPFPDGLRMIVGGPGGALTTPPEGAVSWSCQGFDEPDLPPSCPPGQRLTLRMSAPGCWDGRHLDVPGHRNHLAWAVNGRCPGSYPVAVPALLVRIIYPLTGTGALRLASGPGSDFGFGFVSGWQPAALARLVRICINAGQQCDTNGPT